MVPPHQIGGYAEKFGSHEPLLPLLCHRSGTHGREDKRHVPEQPPYTPTIHTHMYIQAHQKHFLCIPSSHPLPPSDIKGISIETLMRGTHFESNTLQSLYKKKSSGNALFSQEAIHYMSFSSGGFEASRGSGVSVNLTHLMT